jgi:hypothetical protein
MRLIASRKHCEPVAGSHPDESRISTLYLNLDKRAGALRLRMGKGAAGRARGRVRSAWGSYKQAQPTTACRRDGRRSAQTSSNPQIQPDSQPESSYININDAVRTSSYVGSSPVMPDSTRF